MLHYGLSPLLENTTTLKRYRNSGLSTHLSSLISPGWVQGFLVTKTSPSMISEKLSIELIVSAYSILFYRFFIPWPCLWIEKLSFLVWTKISSSLSIPVGSTMPMSTQESGSRILAFFFKFMNWLSYMLYRMEESTGSFMISTPLMSAYFRVA